MRIAPEGYLFIFPLLIAATATLCGAWLLGTSMSLGIIITVILIFCLHFFRDPVRQCSADDRSIVSPADGKVISIKEVNDNDIGPESISISIFLNVFNVHTNRMPVTGRFQSVQHRPGKFIAAFDHMASDLNEQTEMLIDTKFGRVKMKQIAGLIARRILCYAKKNLHMKKGDRLGFIRFGSRTDVIVPKSVTLHVELGQKVTGTETIIGTFK